MTVPAPVRSINWHQLLATAAAVCGPLIAFGVSIESRLAVAEQHAQAEGHPHTISRISALEREAARVDQRSIDIIRRMDEQSDLLREISARIERLQGR